MLHGRPGDPDPEIAAWLAANGPKAVTGAIRRSQPGPGDMRELPEVAVHRAGQGGAAVSWFFRHNVAHDGEGRHSAMLDSYQPGDPMVRVFTYQADPAGRSPEAVAEEAFAICDGHSGNAHGEELSRRYYQRELRSLSFPGHSPCCPRSCCIRHGIVLPGCREGGQSGTEGCEAAGCAQVMSRRTVVRAAAAARAAAMAASTAIAAG